MALPTPVDSDVVILGGVDSAASKSFALQAGDMIVVAMRVYQGDSNVAMSGANITDSVNGAYSLRAHATYFAGGSDRLDEYVFSFESSAAGSATVTINPNGSVAYADCSVSVWRGGTFTLEDIAEDDGLSSSPFTAPFTVPSGDYLVVGSGSFESSSAAGFTSNGTQLHKDAGGPTDNFGQVVAYRTFEASTSLGITWTVTSLSGPVYMGYASAVWRFEASGGSTVTGGTRTSGRTLYAGHAKPKIAGATRAAAFQTYTPAVRPRVAGAHRSAAKQYFAGAAQLHVAGAFRASSLSLTPGTARLVVAGAHRASTATLYTGRVAPLAYVTGAVRTSTLTLSAGASVPVVAGAHRASGLELYAGTANGILGARRASALQLFAGTVRLAVVGVSRGSTLSLTPGGLAGLLAGAHRSSTLALTSGATSPVVAGAHRTSSFSAAAGAAHLTVAGGHRASGVQLYAGLAAAADIDGAFRGSTLQYFAGEALRVDVRGGHRASGLVFSAGAAAPGVVGAHRASTLTARGGHVGDFEERSANDDFFVVGAR